MFLGRARRCGRASPGVNAADRWGRGTTQKTSLPPFESRLLTSPLYRPGAEPATVTPHTKRGRPGAAAPPDRGSKASLMRRRFPADRSRPAGSRGYSGHGVAAARGYAGVTQLVDKRGASVVIADDIDDFEALAERGIPGARRHMRPCWGSTRGAPATPVRAEAVSVATGARGASSRFSLLRSSRACARLVFSRMAPGRVANPIRVTACESRQG